MEYLLKASAVIFIFYLCYTLLLRKDTFFENNRWFLLIGLITALIFPLIAIPIYIPIKPSLISETAYTLDSDFYQAIEKEISFNWSNLLYIVYGLGFTLFLIQFLLQFGSLIILLLKNPKNKDGFYTYIIVKNKVSPFSFFKWIVYNPDLFNQKELQLIINHEKVHVRQFHSIDIILIRLACVVFWFNPFIWFYKKDIQQNLEYIADYKTLNQTSAKKDYQHLLLRTSIVNQHTDLTNNFYNSLIKKRILMLNKSKSKSISRFKFLLVVPLLSILLMSVNTEEVYVENTSTESIVINKEETPKLIEIVFSKDTSDNEFNGIKEELKDQGVSMEINDIKRNSEGQIIAIDISFKTKSGSANYNVDDTKGIEPFYFKLEDDNSFGVGPQKTVNGVKILNGQKSLIEKVRIVEGYLNKNNTELDSVVVSGHAKNYKNINDTIYVKRINNDSVYVKVTGEAYTFKTKDTLVINKPITGRYFYSTDENEKQVFGVTVDDKVSVTNAKNNKPLYIINGKVGKEGDLKRISPNDIESIDVIKDKKATTIYGEKGKNGVIVIKMKDENGESSKSQWKTSYRLKSSSNTPTKELKIISNSDKKPLIIVDGEVLGKVDISKGFDESIIKSMSVFKGEQAIEMYGEEANDGAIVIITKNQPSQNKWITRTAVSSIAYVDDEDDSKNAMYSYINKNTSDSELKAHKARLSKSNISAKFSKVKRNNAGEIIRIKISLSDDTGSKSSATWEDNVPIPEILVGKRGDKLRVTTRN